MGKRSTLTKFMILYATMKGYGKNRKMEKVYDFKSNYPYKETELLSKTQYLNFLYILKKTMLRLFQK